MGELIIKMSAMLNLLKDFIVGHASILGNKIMIDYKGKRYLLTFEEVCDANDEEMCKTIDRYWMK